MSNPLLCTRGIPAYSPATRGEGEGGSGRSARPYDERVLGRRQASLPSGTDPDFVGPGSDIGHDNLDAARCMRLRPRHTSRW